MDKRKSASKSRIISKEDIIIFKILLKILNGEGFIFQITLFFLFAFPLYFYNMNVIPISFSLLLYSQILNHIIHTEKFYKLYFLFGLNSKSIVFLNTIVFVFPNLLNSISIYLFILLKSESYSTNSILNQILTLNTLMTLGIYISNIASVTKLRHPISFSLFKYLFLLIYFVGIIFLYSLITLCLNQNSTYIYKLNILIIFLWMTSLYIYKWKK